MAKYLNEHLTIVGLCMTVLFLFDLYILIFKLDEYKNFIQKHAWMRLFVRDTVSRSVGIATAALFLIMGLSLIDKEIGIFSKYVWGGLLFIAMIFLYGALARYYWRKYRQKI
jgi:hypothetical protein